jgi:GT2 family glycosyltransferase
VIDVVIPAYGNLDITSRAFHAVLFNGMRKQRITVVDNGSHDGALAPLKPIVESFGHRFIRLDKNVGPYGAVNAGLALADADIWAVVCNDVAPLPFSMQYLVDGLDQAHFVGAVEVQDEMFNTTDALEMAESGPEGCKFEPGVFFSCFVGKAEDFIKVGPFDERYRITYGDTDWEQRVSDLGMKYVRALHAPVFHGASVTRKRRGLEQDLTDDQMDHAAFLEKWKDRPDVVVRHPMEDTAFKRAWTAREWSIRGHH